MKIAKNILCLSLAVVACGFSIGCSEPEKEAIKQVVDDGVEDPEINPDEAPRYIRDIIDAYYGNDVFSFGASATMWYHYSQSKPAVVRWAKEFSYNTPENDCKQGFICEEPGAEWDSSPYMNHIDMARKYGQIIRSHSPIGPQVSKWALDDNRTAEELEEMLVTFVTGMSRDLERNSDVVKWYDVVNETCAGSTQMGIGYENENSENVVEYKSSDWFGPKKGNDTWENPWPKMGFETVDFEGEKFTYPIYIRRAFEIAGANTKNVKLIYNEHGAIDNTEAWDKVKTTILYLRSQGLRIDGIGWQAHITLGWETQKNKEALQDMITWCYEHDLEFHITELNVALNWGSYDEELRNTTREGQASAIGGVVEVMLQNVGKGARGINVWVMQDNSEIDTFGSLFSTELQPNLAYYTVRDLLIKYKYK